MSGLGDPLPVPIFKTTANYFDVLGLRPIMGRTFLPQEEEGADVAIITDRFWKARLGGIQDVIGKTIMLDGVTHTIVGVIPKHAGLLDGTTTPTSGRRNRSSFRAFRTNR